MRFTLSHPATFMSICLSVHIIPTFAHTWVETVNLIASDGSFEKTGYARSFSGRAQGVNPDEINTYLLPPNGRSTGTEILPTDPMCKETQKSQKQTPGFPRLTAASTLR